jgi:hypothetical protein
MTNATAKKIVRLLTDQDFLAVVTSTKERALHVVRIEREETEKLKKKRGIV